MNNMNALMKEAQKMQENMQKAQKKLEELEVVGKAGIGQNAQVEITKNCRHDVKKVRISDALVKGDKEILEDLIQAACNNANIQIEKLSQEEITKLTQNISIQDLLKGQEEDK